MACHPLPVKSPGGRRGWKVPPWRRCRRAPRRRSARGRRRVLEGCSRGPARVRRRVGEGSGEGVETGVPRGSESESIAGKGPGGVKGHRSENGGMVEGSTVAAVSRPHRSRVEVERRRRAPHGEPSGGWWGDGGRLHHGGDGRRARGRADGGRFHRCGRGPPSASSAPFELEAGGWGCRRGGAVRRRRARGSARYRTAPAALFVHCSATRMYRRTMALERWPVCAMIARSSAPARAAEVARPDRRE